MSAHTFAEFMLLGGLEVLIASLAIFALATAILMFGATLIKKAEKEDESSP